MAKKKEAQTTGKTRAKRTAKVHKEAERLRVSRDILALTACVLAAVLIALSVRTFGFSLMAVRSDAMQGTLQRGDIVLISRAAQPEAGNIVLAAARNGNVLRRVAGEPGDMVSAAHGEV
ncbi:MAG: S26 family signal peptidase, partial [Clostridia bacterium]|nr:S26 family signal peptidase [Clostridia bacterium]